MALRNNIKNNWTAIPNAAIRDPKLTLKDKGLYTLIVHLPDGWDFSIRGLVALVPDGRDSIMASVNKLEELGYLERQRVRSDGGTLAGSDWIIHAKPMTASPTSEKPTQVKPTQENPPQYKTITNTISTNTRSTDLMSDVSDADERAIASPIKELDPLAYEISDELDRLIQERLPKKYRPKTNVQRYKAALEIHRLHNRDGHDYVIIRAVMQWSQQDDFWSTNILSTPTLRKQFDKLFLRAKSEADKRKSAISFIS